MAGITGQGTTFNLPNYVGELFAVTPTDTPFLSAIGGLTGGKMANSATQHQWQGYDLRTAGQNVALEGANAPTAQERVRFSVNNVLEIHQEAVEVSYTRQAASGQYAGLNIAGVNPVTDEFDWQLSQSLKQVARDIEYSFVNGVYNLPTDNTTTRQTRGILNAVTTNVSTAGTVLGTGLATSASGDTVTATAHGLTAGAEVRVKVDTGTAGITSGIYYVNTPTTNAFKLAATETGAAIDITTDGTVDVTVGGSVTPTEVDNILQQVWDNGGIKEGDTATLMLNSIQKRKITAAYLTAGNYREESRNIAGVNTTQIDTDFGTLNVMLNRYMPQDQIAVLSLEECSPVFLMIPDKGFLFIEPLAKVGSANRGQIYGEIGLEYGNEKKHGVLSGLSTSF